MCNIAGRGSKLSAPNRDAIIFDGALPDSKLPTRNFRMTDNARSLSDYKQIHKAEDPQNGNAWSRKLQKARLKVITPAFLVATVLEGLLASEWAEKTIVVPDEADKFCVAAAKTACREQPNLSVAIFSDDSDFTVFDSGAATEVVQFNGMVQDRGAEHIILRGFVISPSQAAIDIGRANLIELAYHMSKNCRISSAEAIASISLTEPPEHLLTYSQFCRTYELEGEEDDLRKLRGDAQYRTVFSGFDTGVSELVHQARDSAHSIPPHEIRVFLPPLLEDPEKASAHKIGFRIRESAYSILLKATGTENIPLKEFKRAGEAVAHKVITSMDDHKLLIIYGEIQKFLDFQLHQFRDFENVKVWRFITMQVVLFESIDEGWPLPSTEAITSVLMSHVCRSWDAVHLTARYQAALYSLRCLFQILRYVWSIDGGRIDLAGPYCQTSELVQTLEGLPKLFDFFARTGEEEEWERDRYARLVESMLLQADSTWKAPTKEGRRKKNKNSKRRSKREYSGDRTTLLQGNPFALLS